MELKFRKPLSKVYPPMVLIVPLWNWNRIFFNSEDKRFESSNRTFMELKYIDIDDVFSTSDVLIVPLWNWNTCKGCTKLAILSSNRTFMELKSVRHLRRWRCARSNRTFMELKLHCKRNIRQSARVLIVPLWNWNLVSEERWAAI